MKIYNTMKGAENYNIHVHMYLHTYLYLYIYRSVNLYNQLVIHLSHMPARQAQQSEAYTYVHTYVCNWMAQIKSPSE